MAEALSTKIPNLSNFPLAGELIQSLNGALGAIGNVVRQEENQLYQHIRTLEANQQVENSNIIADNKRKELVAILNAQYEGGFVDKEKVTKIEFFARAAQMYGDPALKNYSTMLNQATGAYKYEGIFDELKQSALNYRATKENIIKNLR